MCVLLCCIVILPQCVCIAVLYSHITPVCVCIAVLHITPVCVYCCAIVHPESLTRKTQLRLHAEIAHVSIAVVSLRAFICGCGFLHLRTFVSTVRDRACARTCDCVRVRACNRMYVNSI